MINWSFSASLLGHHDPPGLAPALLWQQLPPLSNTLESHLESTQLPGKKKADWGRWYAIHGIKYKIEIQLNSTIKNATKWWFNEIIMIKHGERWWFDHQNDKKWRFDLLIWPWNIVDLKWFNHQNSGLFPTPLHFGRRYGKWRAFFCTSVHCSWRISIGS